MPPRFVDTVIIGSGPSALLLSYILSGNAPLLRASRPHPDPQLQQKLQQTQSLFAVDVAALTSHFYASRFSYSNQALPVNVLFDTLIRPLADTEPGIPESCIEWRKGGQTVEHVVLGRTKQAGGQWAENPVRASWRIGALSYADLLSLPGWGIEEYLRSLDQSERPGKEAEEEGEERDLQWLRPTRSEVAGYLAAWPRKVGIEGEVRGGEEVGGVRRTEGGFYIASHGIYCRRLVLASGIFSELIPARPVLQPLLRLPMEREGGSEAPLLVVGSGFSAADLIITHVEKRKIIHIFKWDPADCVSPLRACHPQAYPEYAAVYRRMKVAAAESLGSAAGGSPMARRKSNPFFEKAAMEMNYEGLPNTYIRNCEVHGDTASVKLELSDGRILHREVSGLQYVIGRRGSLAYLDRGLREEVLEKDSPALESGRMISGRTLRARAEESIEIAPKVFAIGSLVGDSLIRHSYGSCIMAAGKIFQGQTQDHAGGINDGTVSGAAGRSPANGHVEDSKNEYRSTNGHEHLGTWKEAQSRPSVTEADNTTPKERRKGSRFESCILL